MSEKLKNLGFPDNIIEWSGQLTQIGKHALVSFATVKSATDIELVETALNEAFYSKAFAPYGPLELIVSQKLIAGSDDTLSPDLMKQLASTFASQGVQNVKTTVAAACVVLAHSIADDIFSSCCSLAITCDPKGWRSELDLERKVTLREVTTKSTDEIFSSELEWLRSHLKSKSLPNRAAVFFRRVKIVQHSELDSRCPDFFKLSKLEELDELRHSIVHKSGMGAVTQAMAKDTVDFLQEASMTAIRSMCYAYNIPIEPEMWFEKRDQNKQGSPPQS